MLGPIWKAPFEGLLCKVEPGPLCKAPFYRFKLEVLLGRLLLSLLGSVGRLLVGSVCSLSTGRLFSWMAALYGSSSIGWLLYGWLLWKAEAIEAINQTQKLPGKRSDQLKPPVVSVFFSFSISPFFVLLCRLI